MKTTLKVISWSEDGKPVTAPQKRYEVVRLYEEYAGRNIEVIYRVLPRRSSVQNRYLWGGVYPICTEAFNELGNDFTDETTHEFFKLKFRPKQVIGPGGELIDTIPGTTTEDNAAQFNEYIESIRLFMAETFGVIIPEPGEAVEMKLT